MILDAEKEFKNYSTQTYSSKRFFNELYPFSIYWISPQTEKWDAIVFYSFRLMLTASSLFLDAFVQKYLLTNIDKISHDNMLRPELHIWVWLHGGKSLMKAIIDYKKGSVAFYEDDKLIYLRVGLSQKQLKMIEKEIENKGGKRLHQQSDPFVFLG